MSEIKKALEAAAKAHCSSLAITRCDIVCDECARKAAATIAAFLRRAADVHAGCYGRMEPRELLKHIAAAVEQEARDAG